MKFQRGEKAVTTAGTPVSLGAGSVLVKTLAIKARDANTGRVFPGDSTVNNTDPEQGLNPGDSLTITWPGDDLGSLGDVYVDAAVNGEGVVFWYLGR
jgi:hypothetical protein